MYIKMAIKPKLTRKRYSIAAARNNFTRIVHAAEAGAAVELTRRGKPVAVLLALQEFDRLIEGRRGFRETYQDFLRRHPDLDAVEPDEWLQGVREPAPGRDFAW